MALPDDDVLQVLESEECPGPADLESVLMNETLSSAASHPPLVVNAGTNLAEVLRYMREQDQGAVLVVNDGKLAGIFTERDVLLKIAGCPIDLEQAPVSQFMTPDPVTLPGDA